ncbi:ABC transporter ATP-binding protein [Metabacillus sp. GX 13764]|uniref:ABC transporter ATP-binding protein n=1 Tax=Metabacillus kandeliae TaxID=2900151 RepID=UPI001E2F00AF|nr:ABC transporter ATP-binding protein [Metabacillus kandeliae]MCD7036036.1 ABC transporter ATP-binding protein [Metabacillus kandeliae]
MLEISRLSKKYKNRIWAVKDFDLSIAAGEIVALAGPNGSGKTSIINCMHNIIIQTEGEASLEGYPNTTPEFKKNAAYVPDDLLLPESLTANEYLDFVCAMYSQKPVLKRKKLIELFDMGKACDHPIETYSHGMRKKTQLIAAFMLESRLLTLDEPFRGLDVEAIIVTKKLMAKYAENGGGILLSTHDLLAAEAMCHRIAILSKGLKRAEGTAAALKKKYKSPNMEEVFMKASMLGERSDRFDEIIRNF